MIIDYTFTVQIKLSNTISTYDRQDWGFTGGGSAPNVYHEYMYPRYTTNVKF